MTGAGVRRAAQFAANETLSDTRSKHLQTRDYAALLSGREAQVPLIRMNVSACVLLQAVSNMRDAFRRRGLNVLGELTFSKGPILFKGLHLHPTEPPSGAESCQSMVIALIVSPVPNA